VQPQGFLNTNGPAGLSNASGGDIRPALLRVLTDLYVQRHTHSADEERHYTELALRLLAVVDLPVRIAIAGKLATFSGTPIAVLRRLARDVLEVASPVLAHSIVLPHVELIAIAEEFGPAHAAAVASRAEFSALIDLNAMEPKAVEALPDVIEAEEQTSSLSELFFAADAAERRLILLNLDYAPISPAQPVAGALARDPVRRLEQAALLRNTAEFVRITEDALGLSHKQAARIADDRSGETIVVVAKALAMPADVLQRILLLLNPAIGQSVQRVYDLAQLHDEMTRDAALRLLAIWQETELQEQLSIPHRPMLWDDEAQDARSMTEHPARARESHPETGNAAFRLTAAGS
jgi:uncharacterized protein (DUF2336 family)